MHIKYFNVHSKFVLLSEKERKKKNPESRPTKKWTLTALLKWVCKGRLLKQPEQTGSEWAGPVRVSAQDPTPRNERKVAVFCSNFLRTAAWPALYQRDLSSSLQRVSSPLLMSLLLASLWTSRSSFLFQVVQGLFSSKPCLYAVHKHSHRKKVKIGWTETRNERETCIEQLEEQFKQQ